MRFGLQSLLIATVLCAVYFAAWLFTATAGTFAVRNTIEKRFQSRNVQNLRELTQAKGLAFTSEDFPTEVNLEGPWYYSDRILAPCPCIVALDYGYMSENSGGGARIFLLWFIVILREVKSDFHWSKN